MAALAFLSRLGRPGNGIGLAWHGLAGFVLGLLATAPAALFNWLLTPNCPLLAGWLWLALEMWLSRGLHWDGVADLGDALGSGAAGEKFRAILKDSRMGAFGGMAIFLILAGQALAAGAHFGASPAARPQALAALILAPAWARLGPVWLGFGAKAANADSLGAIICQNTSRAIWLWAWLQGAVFLTLLRLLGIPLIQLLILLCAQLLATFAYSLMARKHGGLSGDFFGSHIECGQLLFLLFTIPVA